MTTYLISYDLDGPNKNYKGVDAAIEGASTGVWCRPLESVYLINSNLSADEISDKISGAADSDDRWLVIEVKNNKQGWLKKEMWEYINNNVF